VLQICVNSRKITKKLKVRLTCVFLILVWSNTLPVKLNTICLQAVIGLEGIIGWFEGIWNFPVFLIIVTGMTSMLIHRLDRLSILKLQYAGFFRIDASEIGTSEPQDLTGFSLR
jgi:hypothetical protein